MINPLLNSRFSGVTDHNRFPQTDALYNPLRKVLLSPQQITPHRPLLNPAASHSLITRDFAYINEPQAQFLRQRTLIPVDVPLVPTHHFQKVRNNRFMIVDAQQKVVGAPITPQQMHLIRSQGMKQERIVWDSGQKAASQSSPGPKIILQPPLQIQPIIKKQIYRTTYTPGKLDDFGGESNQKKKYKYNLFSMIDQQANGQGCGCPNNQIIASKNEPQSINWMN